MEEGEVSEHLPETYSYEDYENKQDEDGEQQQEEEEEDADIPLQEQEEDEMTRQNDDSVSIATTDELEELSEQIKNTEIFKVDETRRTIIITETDDKNKKTIEQEEKEDQVTT